MWQVGVPSLGSRPTQLSGYVITPKEEKPLAVPSLGSSPTQHCRSCAVSPRTCLAVPSLGSSPTQPLNCSPDSLTRSSLAVPSLASSPTQLRMRYAVLGYICHLALTPLAP